MNSAIRIFSFTLIASFYTFAQPKTFQDTLLDSMTGKWILTGTIAGQKTTHDVSASWVLGHQYLQLHEVSHEKDANNNPAYEAIVYIGWNETSKQYTCLWLDVTGSGGLSTQAIANAKRDGNKLPFLFKSSDGSLFHTTFVYNKNEDTWQWLMDGEENGSLQPFARVKLIRKQQIKD